MDPVCHTLAGLAMGHAGLKRRTPLALTTLALAANAPDIDVGVLATDTLAVYFRRGWTHGPIAMAVLPVALAGLIVAWDRLVRQRRGSAPAPVNPTGVLWIAALGTWSHPLLDYMNTYGIRLLMPFSNRWFHGDALYIVDPWLYLALGVAVWLGSKTGRDDAVRRHGARTWLLVAVAYIASMYGSALWARAAVADGLARAGRAGARFMVSPVPVNPFRREVLIDLGERYEKGFLVFAPGPDFRPAGYGIDVNGGHPAARAAAATDLGRQYLTWARFPFFVVSETPGAWEVILNDARYSDPSGTYGWAGLRQSVPKTASPSGSLQ
jgi:inner membrane protein